MGNLACWWKGETEPPGFGIMPNKLNERNMDIQLETMCSQNTELNEFIRKNNANAKKIYRHFDLDALTEFIQYTKEKWSKENKQPGKFLLVEGQEGNSSEEWNTRPGMYYKYSPSYFGEVIPESNARNGLGFWVWIDGS